MTQEKVNYSGEITVGNSKCVVQDASFVIYDDSRIDFNGGTVLSGDIDAVNWNGGIFKGDSLKAVRFSSGFFSGNSLECDEFIGGAVTSGEVSCKCWHDGVFHGKAFTGTWNGGYFNGGDFNGTWNNGTFSEGTFRGTWNGGAFTGGTWVSSSEEPVVLPKQSISSCSGCKYFNEVNDPDIQDGKWHWGVGFYCSCHNHHAPWSKEYHKAVGKDEFEHATINFTPEYLGECKQHREHDVFKALK